MYSGQRHVVFLLGALTLSGLLHAQDFTKKLEGRVQNPNGEVVDVYVVNASNKKSTITDANGYFEIPVRLQDTLIFSAVQFKRKVVLVTYNILITKFLLIPLEETITQLDEVVLMPYNLIGDLTKDAKPQSVVTASTLRLPNAYVVPRTQSERMLYTANTWDFRGTSIKLDPAINWLSGRTLMLRKRVARDYQQKDLEQLQRFFTDSLLISALNIPYAKLNDFLYFCEVDPLFKDLMELDDKLELLDFFKEKEGEYLDFVNSP